MARVKSTQCNAVSGPLSKRKKCVPLPKRTWDSELEDFVTDDETQPKSKKIKASGSDRLGRAWEKNRNPNGFRDLEVKCRVAKLVRGLQKEYGDEVNTVLVNVLQRTSTVLAEDGRAEREKREKERKEKEKEKEANETDEMRELLKGRK